MCSGTANSVCLITLLKKQTKVGVLFGFGQKSLKNVIDVTHTLFLSSEKELSKPTKFRTKLNISPLTPSVLPQNCAYNFPSFLVVRIGIKMVKWQRRDTT